ncbi:dihydrodipicolinate synthase family protein [candidate division KSB1 bacterium]
MKNKSEIILNQINKGVVIPAVPLALTKERAFNEKRQRVLIRYYLEAGVGGIAVGMHFTQFEIRLPSIDLFEPVLRTCSEVVDQYSEETVRPVAKLAGICGLTKQALKEAELARKLGYDFGVVSMTAFKGASTQELIYHMRELSRIIPLFGFYLLTGVGGIVLPYDFWRQLVDLDNIIGIKIAPFNRYQTLDVVRAVAEAGKENDIVLYTGNDESIVHDLITPFRYKVGDSYKTVRIKGGLLGHWAFWTKKAVELLDEIHGIVNNDEKTITAELITRAAQLTDVNSAVFDAAHTFSGSIPGLNEILRKQNIFEGIWTLKPDEILSPGQREEIDRVYESYPHLNDDQFVKENIDKWLKTY